MYDATGADDKIGPAECESRGILEYSLESLLNEFKVDT